MRRLATSCAAVLVLAAAACGGDSKKACDPTAQTGCTSSQVCEPVQNGSPACFAPVLVHGTVSDPTTTPAGLLNGARVVALDANRAPLSAVVVTANDGTTNGAYVLKVRATRDSTGKPVQASITLRADKQGYQTFPGGVRTALPIDLSSATLDSGNWVVSGTLTALQLLPLTNGGAAFIHGSVAAAPAKAGTLVVAEPVGGGAGLTGIADETGSYAIFNLTPGTQYNVTGYSKGVNYVQVPTAPLVTGDNAVANLALGSGTGAPLAGGLIFNNSANPNIQVTLVVQSTYDSNLDRGETPPGLTVDASASGYAFAGVPDGKYVVLAAFGLDGDVRDVSGTGNTAAPEVTVQSGAVVGTPPGFKIIPAVNLLTIDAATVSATPAVVKTATPVFAWQKGSVDSSALTYRVLVFDAFGNPVWSHDMAAAQSDSVTYAGPALQVGMTYQLRILAIKEAMPVPSTFTQLSETEDLAGVFTYQP
jgi:hypothetical protein